MLLAYFGKGDKRQNKGGTAKPRPFLRDGAFLFTQIVVEKGMKHMNLQDRLEELQTEGLAAIKAANDTKAVNDIRVKYLGKKGPITEVLRGMRDLDKEERPKVGALANKVRDALANAIAARLNELEIEKTAKKLEAEKIDVTLPGVPVKAGQPHMLAQIIEKLKSYS